MNKSKLFKNLISLKTQTNNHPYFCFINKHLNLRPKVIIIGGGASGMIAAGKAAESGADVVVLEKKERSGRKLLITGKGRCNITNIASMADFISHIHSDGRFLRKAFSTFFSEDIIDLLNRHGIKTKTERGGRVFPESDLAKDVVDGLMMWLNKLKVNFLYNSKVSLIEKSNDNNFIIQYLKEGRLFRKNCNSVIICTGGMSYPATGSEGDGYKLAETFGHTIEQPLPSLVPLITNDDLAARMQGLSLKNVRADLWIDEKKIQTEFGEMLFTHFGLSGPIILTLSRLAVLALNEKKKVEVTIDLKPAIDDKTLDLRLIRDLNEFGKRQLINVFKEWMPLKMIDVCIEQLKLDPQKTANQVSAEERKKIRIWLKNLRFTVSGHRGFKEAIITNGGINTAEINAETMESKLVRKLFFAGEIIDLCGDTGGYNLQIAWSTAWIAGKNAAMM